jgi:hypothetical protein
VGQQVNISEQGDGRSLRGLWVVHKTESPHLAWEFTDQPELVLLNNSAAAWQKQHI